MDGCNGINESYPSDISSLASDFNECEITQVVDKEEDRQKGAKDETFEVTTEPQAEYIETVESVSITDNDQHDESLIKLDQSPPLLPPPPPSFSSPSNPIIAPPTALENISLLDDTTNPPESISCHTNPTDIQPSSVPPTPEQPEVQITDIVETGADEPVASTSQTQEPSTSLSCQSGISTSSPTKRPRTPDSDTELSIKKASPRVRFNSERDLQRSPTKSRGSFSGTSSASSPAHSHTTTPPPPKKSNSPASKVTTPVNLEAKPAAEIQSPAKESASPPLDFEPESKPSMKSDETPSTPPRHVRIKEDGTTGSKDNSEPKTPMRRSRRYVDTPIRRSARLAAKKRSSKDEQQS